MTAPLPSGKSILIADDSAAQRRFLEMLLGLDGHAVIAARDGGEVVALAAERLPDLIVLDVTMPFADGVKVCAQLKSLDGLEEVPVIILTSRTDETTRDRAQAAGADAVVHKPLLGKSFRGLVNGFLGVPLGTDAAPA